jgi:hypothetical protein
MYSLDVDPSSKNIKTGFYVSKKLAAVIVGGFCLVLIAVGLLVGLVGRSSSDKNENALEPTRTTSDPLSTSATVDPFGNGPWQNNRLPLGISPSKYRLFIYDLDFNNNTYRGTVDIYFNLGQTLDYLLFHIKSLNIENVILIDSQNRTVNINRQFEYKRKQYYVLEPNNALMSGNYTLSVNYNGYTKNGIVGMYQSSYAEDGEKK